MIKSILLKKIASYDASGIYINNLKKINFIYGSNGSGKTTISNFISNPEHHNFSDCCINWVDGQEIKKLVYNKEFRDKNFGKSTIEGVFTLGTATKEDLERIEECKIEQQRIKEDGSKKRVNVKNAKEKKIDIEEAFKKKAWFDVFKKYELVFKEAFRGSMQMESFKNKILNEASSTCTLRNLEYLKDKSHTIFGEKPLRVEPFVNIRYEQISNLEAEEIWETKIVGKGDVEISKLIQSLNINDWVNKGRSYINDTEICPFCQEPTITDTFRLNLEKYFDNTFTSSIAKITELSDSYIRLTTDILNKVSGIDLNEKNNKESKLDKEAFALTLESLASKVFANKELIAKKINEPSRSVTLLPTIDDLNKLQEIIANANLQVSENNKIVKNYNSERDDLIKEVWRFVSEDSKLLLDRYLEDISNIDKSIKGQEISLDKSISAYRELDKEIVELSKNVTSIEPTIIEINTALNKFGFLNFKIVPSPSEPNQYQLQRENGELVESTLSEGEVTFITFLYFLQLAKGSTDENTISEERVLIVDDPISSLDSTILFIVSTLIKEVIKEIKANSGNIKQLILLTHNVYFHKEVSFIDGRTKESKDTNYWIIRKNSIVSTIQSFDMKNPIQTSYDLLWQEIRNREYNSSITIQNTMRRIIENYFKILGKYRDDDLIQYFESKEEQEICRSLLCWINDGSHSISDDLFIESQEDSIEKYLNVFKDIFFYTGHSGHYQMMMEPE